LAGNVELRAQGYETVILTFDDRGYALGGLHKPSLHQPDWMGLTLWNPLDHSRGSVSVFGLEAGPTFRAAVLALRLQIVILNKIAWPR
jgi:hypothetical protein